MRSFLQFLSFASAMLLSLAPEAAEIYQNLIYKDVVRSAQVYPQGNPLGYPAISLLSGEKLEFHFDMMDADLETCRYGIVHCDHNWEASDIPSNEFVQGFQTDQISEFDVSFNTMFDYVHYQFSYPTDMSMPRYSGNYAMVIFQGSDLSDKSNWLITYRFLIYENVVSVLSNVHQSSIIAERYTHQEIDFDINYKDFRIYDPMKEINVSVLQNFNWRTAINGLKPIFLKMDNMTFDYSNGENTFQGENEFRNFDIKDIRYVSAEVSSVTLQDDGYHIMLRQDIQEGRRAYVTWQDLNGKWLVRNDQADDADLESDYVHVHFQLDLPWMEESEVLIQGLFNAFDQAELKCQYNRDLNLYEAHALVKQGYYNYRYVVRDRFMSKENGQIIEGCHAATENDYHIIVYMYDRNLGCDRIIALKADNSVR